MTKSGKIITWSIVIGVVALAGYGTYAYIKKKREEEAANKPRISAADAKSIGAGLGSFISNLFKKRSVAGSGDSSGDTTGGLIY
jgi:hypothetical protein